MSRRNQSQKKNVEVKDLTVDVQILMSGSALGDEVHFEDSFKLLKKMDEKESSRLVLDDRGKINHQYKEKLRGGTYGLYWITNMARKGKIIEVNWGQFNRGVKTKLEENHFNWEDFNYVRTAAKSMSKYLVTHDTNDYSENICKILKKKLKINVCGANDAYHFVVAE